MAEKCKSSRNAVINQNTIMLNVLINAYAVSPTWGSEQGVGWNWIISIARYCNVFVITESEYEKEIKLALESHPYKERIHFFFNAVTPEVRKKCWNQGDWRFYLYYERWQRKTLKIAKQIVKENRIDVIHHLNMVCFREPGYLWGVEGIPFVWGPIGGMNRLPSMFTKGMPLKKRLFYLVKNTITYLQSHYSRRVRKAVAHSDAIISATASAYDVLTKYYKHHHVEFINETGVDMSKSIAVKHDYNHDCLELLWVGRFLITKRLDIALEAIAACKQQNVHLTIAGTGHDADVEHYHTYAKHLGIDNKITWLGRVPNEEVQHLMKKSDAFFFTSVAEATSTVVPEAMSNNLPIICFNACGFGHLVKDKVGLTVELQDPKSASVEFAKIIDKVAEDKRILLAYSEACNKYKYELSWEWKAKKVLDIYEGIVHKD